MYELRLPYHTMDAQLNHKEEARIKRVRSKVAAALTHSSSIKQSFWGDTPLVSPRMAELLRDPETRELVLRAARGQ